MHATLEKLCRDTGLSVQVIEPLKMYDSRKPLDVTGDIVVGTTDAIKQRLEDRSIDARGVTTIVMRDADKQLGSDFSAEARASKEIFRRLQGAKARYRLLVCACEARDYELDSVRKFAVALHPRSMEEWSAAEEVKREAAPRTPRGSV
jgi:hypothetical protein